MAPLLAAPLLMLLGAASSPPAAVKPVKDCDPASVRLLGGTGHVKPAPELPEPPQGLSFKDPVFGTCMVRRSDRHRDQSPSDASTGLVVDTPRAQAFNSSETLLLLRGLDSSWYVYDAKFFTVQRRLDQGGDIEPRWHPTDPDLLYAVSGTSLTRIHVSSGKQETVRDFAADLKEWRPVLVLSRAEGSPSLDGKTMAFLVEEEGTFKVRGMFVYDVAANRITARHDLRGESDQLRNVTISPTGRFVVAAFEACATEALGTMASPCGLMSYDRDFKTARGLARAVAELDVAFDEKYREVVLFQSLERDQINSVEIASGTTVDLTPAGFSKEQGLGLHFSGRALWKPGWGLVSASTDEPRGNWMEDLLFFMELKKGGRVVPIGHHRSRRQREGDDYFAEPHATVNRTATRVLFSSNWGKLGSLDLDTYEVQLAPDWAARVVAK